MVNSHIPRPQYDFDAKKIADVYKGALKEIEGELQSILLSDLERTFLLVKEENIKHILKAMEKDVVGLNRRLMEQAVHDGIASAIYSLRMADSMEEAEKMVTFGKLNEYYVNTVIADSQSDLLAITQNMERNSKKVIRKAVSDIMREEFASGRGHSVTTTRRILDEALKGIDVAIVDNAGRKWRTETYIRMATQTKAMHAHRDASINKGLEEGSSYGIISRHNAVDACRKYEGMIVSLVPSLDPKYPYVEDLPKNEIFHPFCRHMVTPIRDPKLYEDEQLELLL